MAFALAFALALFLRLRPCGDCPCALPAAAVPGAAAVPFACE